MAKKKKSRSRSFTIPLAPTLGLIAGMAEPIQWGIGEGFALDRGWLNDRRGLIARYTGYSPWGKDFDINRLKEGLLPLIAGMLVHKFVGGRPLNLNATLARAGVPLVRL